MLRLWTDLHNLSSVKVLMFRLLWMCEDCGDLAMGHHEETTVAINHLQPVFIFRVIYTIVQEIIEI